MTRQRAMHTHPRVPERRPAAAAAPAARLDPAGPRRRSLWPAVLGVALLLLAATGAMMLLAVLLLRGERIAPVVRVGTIGVGGQTINGAAAAIARDWAVTEWTVRAGEETWTAAPATLGFAVDATATARRALVDSRSARVWWTAVRQGSRVDVPAIHRFDSATATTGVAALAARVDVAPVEATVEVVDGRFVAVPAVPGRALDVAATVAALEANAAAVRATGEATLVVRPVAPAVSDVTAVVAAGNAWLERSLVVHAFDPVRNEALEWVAAPSVWGGWLSISVEPGAPGGWTWSLDTVGVEAYLAARSDSLGDGRYLDIVEAVAAVERALAAPGGRADVRVYHHARHHTVQSGETIAAIAYRYGVPYPWVLQANPGLGDVVWPGQIIAIPSPDDFLPLPVVESKRIVVSIAEQKMWAFEGGAVRWEWPVSTGIADSPTSPGIFQIQTHEDVAYASIWDLYMPHFMGIYRPVPTTDFMNGFHGFPTRNGRNLLWTGNLGAPVTYGCVLVSSDNAAALYGWAEEGVVVEIRP